jgi:hypothetical protein
MTVKFEGLTMNQLAECNAELQSKYEAVVAELEQVSTEDARLKLALSTAMESTDRTFHVLRVETARSNQLAVENSYLLPKAASELSNAWVLHKYLIGIQAAIMYLESGNALAAKEWLYGTISGPGFEFPDETEVGNDIDAWANHQMRNSISHIRALEIIKAETPATEAALIAIRNEAIESAIPEGFVVVPDRINLPAESMEGICFHCGDGGHKFGEFTEGTLFIGEVENDDGSKVYGIHIATADYPEEGCATICEFSQPLSKGVSHP